MLVKSETLESLEILTVKVSTLGEQDFSVEVSSKDDIFFGLTFTCNQIEFDTFAQEQGLDIGFRDFLIWLKELLCDTAQGKSKNSRVFCELDLGAAGMTSPLGFFMDSEFTSLTMLELPMSLIDEEGIKARVSYRVALTSHKQKITHERITKIMAVVAEQNPLLVKEIIKGQSQTGQ